MVITEWPTERKEALQVLMDESASSEMKTQTQKAIRDINVQLEDLMDQAPSDAFAELHVRKVQNLFKGYLKLTSRQRRFIGTSAGSNLSVVFVCLFHEVWQQVQDWKKDRNIPS